MHFQKTEPRVVTLSFLCRIYFHVCNGVFDSASQVIWNYNLFSYYDLFILYVMYIIQPVYVKMVAISILNFWYFLDFYLWIIYSLIKPFKMYYLGHIILKVFGHVHQITFRFYNYSQILEIIATAYKTNINESKIHFHFITSIH